MGQMEITNVRRQTKLDRWLPNLRDGSAPSFDATLPNKKFDNKHLAHKHRSFLGLILD